ncbi:BON domain-containing protein [Flavobacterium magnum]|nr:BON domain-containing protein [Flavobacterium magnum]
MSKSAVTGRYAAAAINMMAVIFYWWDMSDFCVKYHPYMKSDSNIRQQVVKALEANTLLQAPEIAVEVHDGHVTLTGFADKFYKKDLAKKTAREVEGIKSVHEDIRIVIADASRISDDEIQNRIARQFVKNFGNAHHDIKSIVKDGCIWLEGRLKWKYQKDLAGECISGIDGIKTIENNITVPDTIDAAISEKDVFAAIYGDHSITSDIRIEIVGNRVILKGSVENVDQKNLVTRLVRTVPGVKEIENFLFAQRAS